MTVDRRRAHVTVLGAGSWGSTVASIAACTSPTLLWARDTDTAREVSVEHTNRRYLPDARLTESLVATTDLAEAMADADVLVTAIPAQALRGVLADVAPLARPWIPVVSLSKGLERETLQRMTQVIAAEMPDHPAGALSGPNIAREIVDGFAAAATIAMPDETSASRLADLFRTKQFRIYSTTDVIGVELAGAMKNVYAIAVGMADGAGAGANTKAMVMTRAAREMARLGEALGGHSETFTGLAGMGDLITTCVSEYSRNRHVGELLGRGVPLPEILGGMSQVAEGVKTTAVVIKLAADAGIDLPIAREVDAVLNGDATVREAYRGLLRLPPGHETKGEGW